MIKYHILALLCLVAAGISLIELMVILQTQPLYYKGGGFWVMAFVFIFSLVVYFRVKGLRKVAMRESEQNHLSKAAKKKSGKKS